MAENVMIQKQGYVSGTLESKVVGQKNSELKDWGQERWVIDLYELHRTTV